MRGVLPPPSLNPRPHAELLSTSQARLVSIPHQLVWCALNASWPFLLSFLFLFSRSLLRVTFPFLFLFNACFLCTPSGKCANLALQVSHWLTHSSDPTSSSKTTLKGVSHRETRPKTDLQVVFFVFRKRQLVPTLTLQLCTITARFRQHDLVPILKLRSHVYIPFIFFLYFLFFFLKQNRLVFWQIACSYAPLVSLAL